MFDVTIKNGNMAQVLYYHDTENRDEKIPTGTIQEEINAISSFSFDIYPSNPCYSRLFPYTTMVEVYNTQKNRYEFKGRVLKITHKMESDGMVSKSVVCESRLAYLCDTVQPYTPVKSYTGDATRNGLQEFIDVVLNNHNAQVGEDKKIYRGNVTVIPFETSNNVYKGLNYETTFDAIKKDLLESFGGEIDIRESNGLLYLDYVPAFGADRATTIELAKNIESESRDIDPTSIVTRLIPLGEKLKDAEGKDTDERLTIASVNGGKSYIEDTTAKEQYGIIYGVQIWDDVTLAANLKTKGEEYLIANNKLLVNDTITALDLSLLGLDIDDFRLYDSYPVRNELIGVADRLRIVKKTINVIEPYASSFQMGTTSKLLTDSLINYEDAKKGIIRVENEVRAQTKQIVTFVEQNKSMYNPTRVENGTDFNNLKTLGWYTNNSDANTTYNLNMPEKSAFCMAVIPLSEDMKLQLWVGCNGKSTYSRFYQTSAPVGWTDWRRMTGEVQIISAAENESYQCKKYSDGTMEISGGMDINDVACNVALGTWYSTELITPTAYIQSFVGIPDVTMSFSTEGGTGAMVWEPNGGTISDPPTFYLIRPTSSASISGRVSIMAKGRWKE